MAKNAKSKTSKKEKNLSKKVETSVTKQVTDKKDLKYIYPDECDTLAKRKKFRSKVRANVRKFVKDLEKSSKKEEKKIQKEFDAYLKKKMTEKGIKRIDDLSK